MSKLVIRDLEFEIESARLESFFRDRDDSPAATHRFVWGVVVRAKKKDVADSTWIPSFTGESLLETKLLEIGSWEDLVGRHGGRRHTSKHQITPRWPCDGLSRRQSSAERRSELALDGIDEGLIVRKGKE